MPPFPSRRGVPVFLSVALCLVVVALWIRSYLLETLLWESHAGQVLVIGLSQGGAVAHERRDRTTLDGYLRDLLDSQFSPNIPTREHRLLGFYYAHGDDEGSPWGPFRIVGVPYWFLFTVVAAPTAVLLRRRWVASRRHAAALCVTCGYDCRATPERCPECGSAPGS